jgi:dihydrofolate reductase
LYREKCAGAPYAADGLDDWREHVALAAGYSNRMGSLIYTANASLDGFVADSRGDLSWSVPSEEVHQFINDLERDAPTYLYGRRIYEVMAVWETFGLDPAESPAVQDFGRIWRAADKIVFSRTLAGVSTARTSLEREFHPDDIRRLKSRSEGHITIGGATLAAVALRAGLVDEIRLLLHPVSIGEGLRALPADQRLALELIEERRFQSGVVYLRYRVETAGGPS